MFRTDFRFHRGALHFPAARLWLDAHEPIGLEETVFVSHAHSDHTESHARVVLTEPTRRLMRSRVSGDRIEHVLEPGRRHPGSELGIALQSLTLFPAGHILGSAMSLLDDGHGTLLYTGDFKLRTGRSAEPCTPHPADVLVMETTFGRPGYVFPPTEQVVQDILRFCRDALANDEVPVLLGYSLGKSQEILSSLETAGVPVMLTDPVARLTRIYESLGHRFPTHVSWNPGKASGHVVLAPPSGNTAALRRRLGACRVAVLTGWALDPGCAPRHQAEAAFPLSDHADFADLVELVRRVAPRRVYTLHGFATEFASHLRGLGIDARALGHLEQLDLPTVSVPVRAIAPTTVAQPRVDMAPRQEPGIGGNGFARFAATCRLVGEDASKLGKVRHLATFLREVSAGDLGSVVTWFTGRPFPAASNRSTEVGGALLRAAVVNILRIPTARFRQTYARFGDTGDTIGALIAEHAGPQQLPAPSLQEVGTLFDTLSRASGPTQRQELLSQSLRRCDPTEARFLVKILTGNLRIGLKDGLVEEAVAQAFDVPIDTLRQAVQVLGDLGEGARMAREGRLHEAALIPLRPISVMLASPEPDAASILERASGWVPTAGQIDVWIEDKYDGIRCQLHKHGDRVALYTRDLKEITATFPELVKAAQQLPGSMILDGEVLGMEGDRVIPFTVFQRRLGRSEGDLFLQDEVPVRFLVFDLLHHEGIDWIHRPLRERRSTLESLALPERFTLARITRAGTKEAIDQAFLAARARGHEGLMIKDPESRYTPGRRGLSWLKLKKAYATLDCVVVRAEYGHGRRHGVLSDYTFAVRDDRDGGLRVIGKAYSGLTQEEIAGLTTHFLGRVLRQEGRVLEVTPDVVLEIAFDAIQPSPRHDSGLALRFPRIIRIRTDKSAAEIDTLDTARKLSGGEERGPTQRRGDTEGRRERS